MAGKAPKPYVKCIAELEDFLNESIAKQKVTPKKMSKQNAQGLNAVKQKIKKTNKEYQSQIEEYKDDKDGYLWESEEEERKHAHAPSGWGFKLFYNRALARLSDSKGYYTEPAFPKLLPDVDPAFERPYTLVLSLEDLLVHSEWTREHGWRMAKRPGVDYFLRYLQQYYELVIFTSAPMMMAEPVIRKLDPYRVVMWPLFREATKYVNGEHVKVGTLQRTAWL